METAEDEEITTMELQQSPPYANYIKKLHWKVETVDSVNIFIRTFPLMGAFAKLQRIDHIPDINAVLHIFKKYNVKRIVLEASSDIDPQVFKTFADTLKKQVAITSTPYIPTKTILVNVQPSEDEIFKHFTEAKRRAVRRAQKNKIEVEESSDIHKLIKVKNKSAGLMGFITTSGLKQLWESFRPDKATTVLAFDENRSTVLGGICLVFWENTAYYWIAGATKKGKKLFVPTLLVWEAIKISKKRGMQQFDFVGVWDERFPDENKDWLGFTKFKEGFGGTPLYYPSHR